MKHLIYNVIFILSIMLMVLVIASYINVLTHNMVINYSYPIWNVFQYL
jgi:hypothetical protein|nr:MAG TPA: hypothetical protein [Bacteriophage sp.]